jgi:hypothetical protein
VVASIWLATRAVDLAEQCKRQFGPRWQDYLGAAYLKVVRRRAADQTVSGDLQLRNIAVTQQEDKRDRVSGFSRSTRVLTNCHGDESQGRSSLFDRVASFSQKPVDEIIAQEARLAATEAINSLPAPQRDVVGLVLSGLTIRGESRKGGACHKVRFRLLHEAIDGIATRLGAPPVPRGTKGSPRINFLAFREWDERWLGGHHVWVTLEHARDGFTVIWSVDEDSPEATMHLCAAKGNSVAVEAMVYTRGEPLHLHIEPGHEVIVEMKGVRKVEASASMHRQLLKVGDPFTPHN